MKPSVVVVAILLAAPTPVSAAITLIPVEAGETQKVELRFPSDLPRDVLLTATIEGLPEHIRDQVQIDVLPREFVIGPGMSPGVYVKVESDKCSPNLFFRTSLVLTSAGGTTTSMPLNFRVTGSPIACWGPLAGAMLLVGLLLYAVYSWGST